MNMRSTSIVRSEERAIACSSRSRRAWAGSNVVTDGTLEVPLSDLESKCSCAISKVVLTSHCIEHFEERIEESVQQTFRSA